MTRIILVTETTGLNAALDEVLQLAIIDADTGDVLHNRLYGTRMRKEWIGAEAVNGISPEDVAGLPSLYDDGEQATAAEIIGAADWVGGWNVDFDLSMLWGYKIAPRDDAQIVDVMKLDAEICGTLVPLPGGVKWRKLADAATWWGFDLVSAPGVYHNAETDCLATRHVWRKIMQWHHAEWNTETRKKYLYIRGNMQELMEACGRLQSEMLRRMTKSDDECKDTVLGQLEYDMPLMYGFLNIMADYAENPEITQEEIKRRQINVVYEIAKRMGLQ